MQRIRPLEKRFRRHGEEFGGVCRAILVEYMRALLRNILQQLLVLGAEDLRPRGISITVPNSPVISHKSPWRRSSRKLELSVAMIRQRVSDAARVQASA